MAKLFIGYVAVLHFLLLSIHLHFAHYRGLAWHTDDQALSQKFSEFGQVLEAVKDPTMLDEMALTDFRLSSKTATLEGVFATWNASFLAAPTIFPDIPRSAVCYQ